MKRDAKKPSSIDDGGQTGPTSQEPSGHGSGNSTKDANNGKPSARTSAWRSYIWSQTKFYVPKGVNAVKSYSERVLAPGLQSAYQKGYNKFKEKVNDPEVRENVRKKAETGARKSNETWKKYTPLLFEKLSSNSQWLASQAGYGMSRVASSDVLTGWLKRTRNFTLLLVFGGMFMYGLGKSLPDVVARQYNDRKKGNGESEEPATNSATGEQGCAATASSLFKTVWPRQENKQEKGADDQTEASSLSSWSNWIFGQTDAREPHSEKSSNENIWWPYKSKSSSSQNTAEEQAPIETSKGWTDWIRGK